jgi:N utilization substance protein A
MANKEILQIAEVISNEKEVSRESILEAIEMALATATRKKSGKNIDVRVEIDPKTGDYVTYRRWTVIDEDDLENIDAELTEEEASERGMETPSIGDVLEEEMESIEFGRIAAQIAKQVIVQKVREAERGKVADAFAGRVGDLVFGTVKKVSREGIIVDLGQNAEGFLKREECLPKENFRTGDRLRAYLYEVQKGARGPQMLLSRTKGEMLASLFQLEVPEIAEQIIEICAVARDPGMRAKIAVKTNDRRIDPVGACVGVRGSRVQVITEELGGERIDIILWDQSDAQFVINALAPAEVESIVVDEENHSMDIAVAEAFLSQAIGRNGQNVKLASQLTGWRLNVMSSAEAEAKSTEESSFFINGLMEALGIEEDLATILVEAGFKNAKDITSVKPAVLLNIEGFDEELVEALCERAKMAVLGDALSNRKASAADLLALEGMSEALANALANKDIFTQEDLAEQSIEDLMDIEGMTEERATRLILLARAPWFS